MAIYYRPSPPPPPSLWAIIPVKPLGESKQRLAHLLSPAQRADLIHLFLDRTLATLQSVPGVANILLVSSDSRALNTARQHGAETLVETAAQGLNIAVTQGAATAVRAGATAVLILPADLPFIAPYDVQALLDVQATGRMVICSDDQAAGTNALLLDPPHGFTFHYGPDSYTRHRQEARRCGLTAVTISAPGLQFDLDTEADWHKYQLTVNHSQFTVHNS